MQQRDEEGKGQVERKQSESLEPFLAELGARLRDSKWRSEVREKFRAFHKGSTLSEKN